MTTPKYIRNAIALMVLLLTASLSAQAQTIIRKDSIASQRRAIAESELVIARGDTTSIILPEHNFGRFDRGLYNYLFIPKGSWSLGLSKRCSRLSRCDVQIRDVVRDFDV